MNQNDGEKKSDIYGFTKKTQDKEGAQKKDMLKQNNARIEKWRKMMPEINKMIANNDEKLKARLRKGIPEGIRMLVWPLLAEVESSQKQAMIKYAELVDSQVVSPHENQIQLDIIRTFQNNHLFSENSVTSQSMYKVLRAISLQFEKMGYCQGLNFLAGSFLLLMSEELVFWHIYSLLDKYKYIEIYINPQYAFQYLYVFQHLMEEFLPDVAKKLEKLDIQPFYYATEWFITLFSSILPMVIFLRVMDVFWYEKIKVIFRTALAIVKIRKDEILAAKTFEKTIQILKDYDFFYKFDTDKFMKIASKDFIFSTDHMKKLTNDFIQEEKIKSENKKTKSSPKK